MRGENRKKEFMIRCNALRPVLLIRIGKHKVKIKYILWDVAKCLVEQQPQKKKKKKKN